MGETSSFQQRIAERMQQHSVFYAAVVFNFLFALTLLIAFLNYRLHRHNEQREMRGIVSAIEDRVADMFSYSELAAMNMAQAIMGREPFVPGFDSIAEDILSASDYLDAVQMVPGGVISQVYPYERHRSVIGYDILADDKVNKEALEAIRTKRMMFAGPITLRQGGEAVVGRLPVFRDGKFWGFSVVLITLERLVENLGIQNSPESSFYYKLSKVDPNTGQEKFFLSPPKGIDESSSFDLKVFPESGWRIYVMSANSSSIWYSTVAVVFIGSILSLFASFLVRSFLDRGRQLAIYNQRLEWQHKEMRDSIVGASYLQQSVLPTKDEVVDIFERSFVLYRPKDAVSGDFFWARQKEDVKIVAAVDCTGHGVSAALLSMVANQLLYQVVDLEGLRSPSAILSRLNELITVILQSRGDITSMDGMDMVLCAKYAMRNELVFASANRPLYLVNEKGLQEFSGSRYAIGGHRFDHQKKIFEEEKIPFNEGDIVYLTSDGYHSQFGGERNKKMGRKHFRKVLSDAGKLPIKAQHNYLERMLTEWANGLEQVDDILIIGIQR